jgi:type VI protein secretion system component Hcp
MRLGKTFVVRAAAVTAALAGVAIGVPAAVSHAAVARPSVASKPAATAAAATPAGLFLQVSGIPGESTARGHGNWIAVSSYTLPVKTTGSSSTGAGAGKVSWGPLQVTLPYSVAVPPLEGRLATGVLSTVTLQAAEVRQGAVTNYLTITLTNAAVTSLTETSTGGRPQVEITFNAQKACESYTPPGPGPGAAPSKSQPVSFCLTLG